MIDEPTRLLDEGPRRGLGRDLIPRVLAGLVRRGEDFDATEDGDDTLFLLFCCCYPDLTPATQVALRPRTAKDGSS